MAAPYVLHEGRRWRRGCTNGGGFEISVSWAAAREDSSVSMVAYYKLRAICMYYAMYVCA